MSVCKCAPCNRKTVKKETTMEEWKQLSQEAALAQSSMAMLAQAADRAGADDLAEAVRRAAVIASSYIRGEVNK